MLAANFPKSFTGLILTYCVEICCAVGIGSRKSNVCVTFSLQPKRNFETAGITKLPLDKCPLGWEISLYVLFNFVAII